MTGDALLNEDSGAIEHWRSTEERRISLVAPSPCLPPDVTGRRGCGADGTVGSPKVGCSQDAVGTV